jgi:hypothetical protein
LEIYNNGNGTYSAVTRNETLARELIEKGWVEIGATFEHILETESFELARRTSNEHGIAISNNPPWKTR